MPTSTGDVKNEIRNRIKFWHEMADHPGSGKSGRMKSRMRAQVLSDLLGWINEKEKTPDVSDTEQLSLGL